MGLWSKLKSSAPRKAALRRAKPVKQPKAASNKVSLGMYSLVPAPSGDGLLVFGMAWTPVLQANREKAARAAARAAKATHYIVDAKAIAGMLRLGKREKVAVADKRLYSAAQAFAQTYSYCSAAAVITLPNGAVWSVVAKHGVVSATTDRVFVNADAAKNAGFDLEGLLAAHGGREAFEEILEGIDLSTITSNGLPRALLRKAAATRPSGFHMALMMGILGCAGLVAWQELQQRQARARAQALQTMTVDPAGAWQGAVAGWKDETAAESLQSLYAVLEAIDGQRLSIGGWTLISTECAPSAVGWSCTSKLTRTRLATNQTLQGNLPEGWKVEWPTLDDAKATFSVPVARDLVRTRLLPDLETLDRDGISALQQIKRAYSTMTVQKPVPVPLTPPLNSAGQPLPAMPPSVARPYMREFEFNGPLRSAYVLPVDKLPLTLTAVDVTVNSSFGAKPDLVTSTLGVKLKGNLYAVQ